MKAPLLLLACLLALAGQPAAAQQVRPGPAQAASRPAPPTGADSAAVLHQLFRRARRGGWLLGGAVALNTNSQIQLLQSDVKAGYKALGILGLGANIGLLVIGIGDQIKYSRRRERETIEQLRLHQPLRRYVQHSYALALAKAARPAR